MRQASGWAGIVAAVAVGSGSRFESAAEEPVRFRDQVRGEKHHFRPAEPALQGQGPPMFGLRERPETRDVRRFHRCEQGHGGPVEPVGVGSAAGGRTGRRQGGDGDQTAAGLRMRAQGTGRAVAVHQSCGGLARGRGNRNAGMNGEVAAEKGYRLLEIAVADCGRGCDQVEHLLSGPVNIRRFCGRFIRIAGWPSHAVHPGAPRPGPRQPEALRAGPRQSVCGQTQGLRMSGCRRWSAPRCRRRRRRRSRSGPGARSCRPRRESPPCRRRPGGSTRPRPSPSTRFRRAG